MDSKKQAELDQAAALLGDNLPILWYRLYQKCLDVGFSDLQSMEIVKAYIVSQGNVKI
jgi:hypothetical protein